MKIVFLEGNIGAGKSTCLKHWLPLLGDGVTILDEPLDVWLSTKDETGTNLLDKFYQDPVRWGFTFQMAAFISRIQRYLFQIGKTCIKWMVRLSRIIGKG